MKNIDQANINAYVFWITALDTINRDLFLEKLKPYTVNDSALDFFNDRQQVVKLSMNISED